jgi:hypothetical protein
LNVRAQFGQAVRAFVVVSSVPIPPRLSASIRAAL